MNISVFLVHIIYLLQIAYLIFPVSRTISLLVLMMVMFSLFIISLLQNNSYRRWTFRSLYENGVIFFGYYIIALSFGFLYGYNFGYSAVNIFLVLPLLYFLFIPKNINTYKLLNIVLFYSIITMIFSYVELFAWDQIWFLQDVVDNSYDEKGHSSIYNEKDGIKVFGIFSDAVRNGLILIFGFVILLERFSVKHEWIYFVGLLLFVIAIYFTHTRNNYLTLLFVSLIWVVISKAKKDKLSGMVWLISLSFYICVFGSAILLAYLEGQGSLLREAFSGESSIQARVISWVIIVYDYFLSDPFSYRTLFGYALTQFENEISPEKTYWKVDNSLLMVYLGSGITGVILFLSWIKSALNVLSEKYIQCCNASESSNIKILIVMLMAYFINGVMNASILSYTFILPILIMLSRYTRQKTC